MVIDLDLTAATALTTGTLLYFHGRPVTIAQLAGETTGLLASMRH